MGDALLSTSGGGLPLLPPPETTGDGDRWRPVRLAPLADATADGDPRPRFTSWFTSAGGQAPMPKRPAWLHDRLAPAQAVRPSSQAAAIRYRQVSLSS